MAAGSLFALAGCKKKVVDNRVSTTANWNVITSNKVEKNYSSFWQSHKEVASYAIGFEKGSNNSYSVNYNLSDAEYVTEFYMTYFNWDTGEATDTAGENCEAVYAYATRLTITGYYELTSDSSQAAFEDSTETVCYFRPSSDNLQPVYSYQAISNTAPTAASASNVNNCFIKTEAEFEARYNRDCTEATVTSVIDGKIESSTVGLTSKENYSLFDNTQLRAAVRAFTLSGGASRTFNVFIPQENRVQTCTASISDPAELKVDGDNGIIAALADAQGYIFFDGSSHGEETPRTSRYNAVQLSIASTLKGPCPTYWYSTVENGDVNASRCVLLKMTTPLSYGLGTISYSLKQINCIEK